MRADANQPNCPPHHRASGLPSLVWTFAAQLAVLLVSGAHWVTLQAVAFGSMIGQCAREAPLRQAVANTFDGRHPDFIRWLPGGEPLAFGSHSPANAFSDLAPIRLSVWW